MRFFGSLEHPKNTERMRNEHELSVSEVRAGATRVLRSASENPSFLVLTRGGADYPRSLSSGDSLRSGGGLRTGTFGDGEAYVRAFNLIGNSAASNP